MLNNVSNMTSFSTKTTSVKKTEKKPKKKNVGVHEFLGVKDWVHKIMAEYKPEK